LPARRYHLLPPAKTLWLRHEPSHIERDWPYPSYWPARFSQPAFTQSFLAGSVPMVATWWINMDYDTLTALQPPPKSKPLSCIASGRTMFDGQRARVAFLRTLAERCPHGVDIFGRGLKVHALGAAYKGPLERDTGFPLGARCKYDGLRDYRYSLCIENGRERNYYTEKIVDAWLAWTVPIYYGCPNLADYYPQESFIAIDIADSQAADEIVRIAREPVSARTLEAIAEARHLALNRYSVWGTVEHLLVAGGRSRA
jgi:hypothetical protein